jgi:hypothetical protein
MSETMNPTDLPPKVCVVYPTMKTATERYIVFSFTGRFNSGGFLRFERGKFSLI